VILQTRQKTIPLKDLNRDIVHEQVRNDFSNYWPKFEPMPRARRANEYILMLVSPINQKVLALYDGVVAFLNFGQFYVIVLKVVVCSFGYLRCHGSQVLLFTCELILVTGVKCMKCIFNSNSCDVWQSIVILT